MPQMSPMNWITLFMYFNSILLLVMSTSSYFSKMGMSLKDSSSSGTKAYFTLWI